MTEKCNIIKDYSYFLSKRGKLKEASPIRSLFQYSGLPGMISLGGGLPNASTFPFKSINIELKDGSKLEIEGSDLEEAFQYSPTPGLPRLQNAFKDLQIRQHNLCSPDEPGKEWNLIISNGSQESLVNAFEVLVDDNDSIIAENPTYSGTLSILRPLSLNICGIETDRYGMIPEKLEKLLSEWDHSKFKFPRVIYLIPCGQNPSGTTMNHQRKVDLYSICSRFNLLIIEDDPYYYLQFESENKSEEVDDANNVSSNSNGIISLGKSFLSMDVDGRVLRFDSLSKILSSGLRIGFVTGNKYLLEKINFHQQSTTLHSSGLSQAVVLSLLNKWGIEKWNQHIQSIQRFYLEKRNQMIESIDRHLKGLVEFNVPSAGMFIWFKLLGVEDSKALIFKKAVEKKVLLVPGISFSTDLSKPSQYVRACFSTASKEQMDEAIKRFAELLSEELNNK
ncbi:hypothetical protein RB653_008204 [Dictyostelium firmibasis]|uniref:Aminotransferase class I/classII large domain-containing protein n=1 Tax=Dictyostelium firmibasis TaxID=79012 RepID=A0AAN7TYI6_9MYCE